MRERVHQHQAMDELRTVDGQLQGDSAPLALGMKKMFFGWYFRLQAVPPEG